MKMATKIIFLFLVVSAILVVSTNARSLKIEAKSGDENINSYYPPPRPPAFSGHIGSSNNIGGLHGRGGFGDYPFGNSNANNDESVPIGSGKVEVSDGALGRD
ncbi:hypothetical protein RND71_012127 [Anisodus tanguticus]|uniref:Glycine-rich protein n=1 Tax=Anisodus tanguticus TaxID=243964 RepID=A0AAE1VQG6_9SOLA|nr:hypothetical protein RND71_012127 [Anisodus tanguticus]